MVLVAVSLPAEGGTGEYCVGGRAVDGGGVGSEYCGTARGCWLAEPTKDI